MFLSKIKKYSLIVPFWLLAFIWLIQNTTGYWQIRMEEESIFEYVYTQTTIYNISMLCIFFLFVCHVLYYFKAFSRSIPQSLLYIYIFVLLISVLFWIEALLYHDTSFVSMIRMPLNPLFCLIYVYVVLAFDEDLFHLLVKNVLLVSVIFLLIDIYLLVTRFETAFAFGISPLMQFRTAAFWGFVFYLVCKPDINRKYFFILLIGFLLCTFIGAIIISRSWIIQGLLSLILLFFCYYRQNVNKTFPIFIFVIFIILLFIYGYYVFKDTGSYEFLMNKMYNDSRSGQYFAVMEQFSFYDFLLGGGAFTMWIQNNVEYAYIDNQTIFFMYRYGLLLVLFYYLLVLFPAVKIFFSKRSSKIPYFLFMWVLAINGLAVFNGVNWDWPNLLVMVACGRCWFLLKNEG